ncbi:hypothetical protein [Saccharicrinis sp. 156]|uniref:hypothetical protein n=1 Tax=Saccharicrinis sp. 156 TaxID=3417574 RepID=UPI003D354D02
MLSEEEKNKIIKTVTQSSTFQKVTTGAALLKYLAKAEIEDTFLKEDIIDIEFFGKKDKPDKSNTRVRVSMYNLRKKLDDYYANEGARNEWHVVIDKGQYSVRYKKKVDAKLKTGQFIGKHTLIYAAFAVFIISLIVVNQPPKKPKVWEEFINNKTTLFIGDAFGMRGNTITGQPGFTRDYNINSIEEYYKFIEGKPELKNQLKPAYYQYFTGMGAFATRDIAQLFTPYHRRFDIKFDSNTSLDDIKNGNAIYAGPLLTNCKFIPFFNDANEHFKVSRYTLTIKDVPNMKDTTINISTTGKTMDYAIVSKYPGPMGTEHFVFFSNHDMGVSATVEYFTNIDSLKQFTKQHLEGHKNFTALFKAHGRERTSLDLKLLWVFPFN